MLDKINTKHLGFSAVVIGLLVLFGSLGKLGVLQAFFHTIMIIAGLMLLLWGLDASELLKSLKKFTK